MECNFSLHPIYMKIIHEGFKTTRAKALHTLGAAKEVLGRHVVGEVQGTQKTTSEVLKSLHCSATTNSGGLLDLGPQDI